MADNTPKVDEIVETLDDTDAGRALIKIAAILGSTPRWHPDIAFDIAAIVDSILAGAGTPPVDDLSPEALETWQGIAEELGVL